MLKAVPECCCLGDMLSAGGVCELAVGTFSKCPWGILPTATASHQPQSAGSDRRLGEFNRRYVMLHVAGTWAMSAATLNHIQRNDGSVLSRQSIKARTPFSQSLASGTWMKVTLKR